MGMRRSCSPLADAAPAPASSAPVVTPMRIHAWGLKTTERDRSTLADRSVTYTSTRARSPPCASISTLLLPAAATNTRAAGANSRIRRSRRRPMVQSVSTLSAPVFGVVDVGAAGGQCFGSSDQCVHTTPAFECLARADVVIGKRSREASDDRKQDRKAPKTCRPPLVSLKLCLGCLTPAWIQ